MKKFKLILFWFLSFTWGIICSLVGSIAAIILIVTGHKPKHFYGLICFETGKGWGGINLGPFFMVEKTSDESLKRHEAGHAVQNIILGPLMPFIIGIPSFIRAYYREYLIKSNKKTINELPEYDAIWFEGWATKIGEKYFK